jgi:CheY-like chemotaxis protein
MTKKTILIAEEDAGIREFLTSALNDEGYDVIAVEHGAALLEALKHCENACLIFLDVQMPVMDGRAFLDEYYSLPGSHLPVVAMSGGYPYFSYSLREVIRKTNAFLEKPFNLDELIELAEKYCPDET